MSISPAEPVSGRPHLRSQRDVALARAGAAVLWAIVYLLALHGQRVLTGSGMPVLAGLILAAYPVIDAVASILSQPRGPALPRTDVVIDGLAVAGLIIATLVLPAQSVLVVFGAWALVSGLRQLTHAWGAGPRRVQLPLIISGGLSAIAGLSFAVLASQRVAPLSYLGGYAVLGAILFLAWTYLSRRGVGAD